MRSLIVTSAVVAASVSGASAASAFQDAGNWYQNAVQKITYTGVGAKSGSYQKVVNMANGACDKEPQSYSGSMAPLDEDVSINMRGPLVLYEFAVYTPAPCSSKAKRTEPMDKRHAHGHAHFHAHNKQIRALQDKVEKEKRADMVTAVINGVTQSWVNDYHPGAAAATPAPAAANDVKAAGFIGTSTVASAPPAVTSSASSTSSDDSTDVSDDDSGSGVCGDWNRVAHWANGGATQDGLVVLANFGGQGSGVFDNTYGNSLSYSNSDASGGTAGPSTFSGNLSSNHEAIFFSNKKCGANGAEPCGYYRPGSVAYQGWAGKQKAFVFDFEMPHDGNTGFNGDMSSLWALNGKITRTGQYSGCCCWATGCGEFDICEVLNSGNDKCKSTYHSNTPGGSSDYFDRPTTKPAKMVALFDNDQIVVEVLTDDFSFSSTMSKAQVQKIVADTSSNNPLSTLFALVS